MDQRKLPPAACALAAITLATFVLTGCESTTSLGKKIDYKSTSSAPALELPPELKAPQYDDRYNSATASGIAARDATRPKGGDSIAQNSVADAKIMKSGNERWLVVKTTPENAWTVAHQFWIENGFVLANEQPAAGVMETDWAENRADIPQDFIRSTIGKYLDVFYTTYKREKYHTRIERGTEPGIVEIYISSRVMEQVPTKTENNGAPSGFAWGLMPSNPDLDAEWLGRMMVRFGTPETQAAQIVKATGAGSAPAPEHALLQKASDGASQLIVDDGFDRAWRRVGLALDRVGFTVVDRDRSKGFYYVRYADPEAEAKKEGVLSKLMFWKDKSEKPEQYRITVAQADPRSIVTVQDPNGAPDKTVNGEKILSLLKDQLK